MEWLSLAEYSIKQKVSISTLRRRIKAEDIQYRLDDGKYFILDSQENLMKSEPAEDQFETIQTSPSQGHSSSAVSVTYNLDTPEQLRVENIVRSGVEKKLKETPATTKTAPPPPPQFFRSKSNMPSVTMPAAALSVQSEGGESVLTAANRLLTDLKKAYTQVLQEKEQLISDLREENSDLKTLIKVLESENDRLRDQPSQ
jgi:hypothetical protein